MRKYLIIIILPFLCMSCIPDENPVQAFNRGDAIVEQVGMGELYRTQVYFSLEANKTLKSNQITDWDIAFADSESHNEVMINYSLMAKAYKVNDRTYDAIDMNYANSIADTSWEYDNPQGDLDSLAISGWYSTAERKVVNNQYVIDLGVDEKGKKLGKYKFQITDLKDDTYYITHTNLKTNITNNIEIKKSNKFNYKYLSFAQNTILELEPESGTWDLLFSKNTTLLYTDLGEPTWYSVTSALINPFYVEATQIQDTTFENIDNSIIPTLHFTKIRDAVGHEWKTYQFDSGSYVVNSRIVFIIKSINGFYYKLHFLDYYNASGIKGYPKFEFKKL